MSFTGDAGWVGVKNYIMWKMIKCFFQEEILKM